MNRIEATKYKFSFFFGVGLWVCISILAVCVSYWLSPLTWWVSVMAGHDFKKWQMHKGRIPLDDFLNDNNE